MEPLFGRRMRRYPRMEASIGFLNSPCHKNRLSRSQSPWPCGMMFTMICSPIWRSPKSITMICSPAVCQRSVSVKICTAASQAARPPGDCWPACCLIFMTWKVSRGSMWIRTAFGTSPDTAGIIMASAASTVHALLDLMFPDGIAVTFTCVL